MSNLLNFIESKMEECDLEILALKESIAEMDRRLPYVSRKDHEAFGKELANLVNRHKKLIDSKTRLTKKYVFVCMDECEY